MLNRQTGRRIDRHTDEFASLQTRAKECFALDRIRLALSALQLQLHWIGFPMVEY